MGGSTVFHNLVHCCIDMCIHYHVTLKYLPTGSSFLYMYLFFVQLFVLTLNVRRLTYITCYY